MARSPHEPATPHAGDRAQAGPGILPPDVVRCLTAVDVFGLAPTLVIADAVLKAASVDIVGVEGDTGQNCLLKVVGDAANCRRAAEVAEQTAARLNAKAMVRVYLRFIEPPRVPLIYTAQEYSGITDGYLQMLPRPDYAGGTMTRNRAMQAIGMLETQGLSAVIEGSDAMLKAANVEIVGKEKIGAAHVTVLIRGDVAAVKAAIEAGQAAAAKVGKVVAAHVIARPHDALAKLLPE